MILCPRKTLLIDPEKWPDHIFREENGIAVFLKKEMDARLKEFLPAFETYRKEEEGRLTDPKVYDQLPFVQFNTGLWKLRQYDLQIIQHHLKGRKKCEILEVGAWNGWLSNRLTQEGHSVTAIDFFTDEFDGLGAKKHYSNPNWTTIQMDTEELSVIEKGFDLIIFNRSTAYFSDIVKCHADARKLLNPKGMIIATGIHEIQDESPVIAHFERVSSDFEARFKTKLFFKPAEKMFTRMHTKALKEKGFSFHFYPQLWKARLLSWIKPQKPRQFYAVFLS